MFLFYRWLYLDVVHFVIFDNIDVCVVVFVYNKVGDVVVKSNDSI